MENYYGTGIPRLSMYVTLGKRISLSVLRLHTHTCGLSPSLSKVGLVQ